MTIRMGRVFSRLSAVLFVSVLAAPVLMTPAAAQSDVAQSDAVQSDPLLEPFLGYWYGTTDPGADEVRDISVLIRTDDAGGFRVDWDNYTVIDERASDGAVEFRENELEFLPSAQEDGLWQSDAATDEIRAWAQIEDNILTVTIEATDPIGRAERQVYRRIVSGDQMQLFYQRLLDGEVNRELSGSLTLVYEEGALAVQ